MKRSQPLARPTRLQRGKPMKRGTTPMKQRNATRGGSSFPKQRDDAYRRWIRTENACLLRGAVTLRRLSIHDIDHYDGVQHMCWGAITPAHVGKHQATGAADFGRCVPLCQAAHQFYDEHRHAWARYTWYTAVRMESAACDYARKYVEAKRAGEFQP